MMFIHDFYLDNYYVLSYSWIKAIFPSLFRRFMKVWSFHRMLMITKIILLVSSLLSFLLMAEKLLLLVATTQYMYMILKPES